MEPSLNIELAPTPTRQRFWRVVRLGTTACGAWLGILALTRLCFAWSDIAPTPDHVHLRIVKSPETVASLRAIAKGRTVIPGVPFSLSDIVASSHGVVNIDFAPDGSTTLILDYALSERDQAMFTAFGANVSVHSRETVVTNASSTPTPSHDLLSGVFTTLVQESAARLSAQDANAAIDLDKTMITIHGIAALTPPEIESTPEEQTLVFASFSPTDLQEIHNRTFTQNTPGLSNFFSLATATGLSATVHQREDGIQYTFATPITEETRSLVNESALRSLASELTEIPTIEGIANYLDDGSRTIALRSREEATIVLRDERPYRFLNATSSKETVTITETPTFLTVSNTSASSHTPVIPSCLPGTRAFVKPQGLQTLFPEQTLYRERSIGSLLWDASVIASSSTQTRVCMEK